MNKKIFRDFANRDGSFAIENAIEAGRDERAAAILQFINWICAHALGKGTTSPRSEVCPV